MMKAESIARQTATEFFAQKTRNGRIVVQRGLAATKSETRPFREGEAPAEPKRIRTIFQRLGRSLALPSGSAPGDRRLGKRAQKTRTGRIVVRKNTEREKRFFNHRGHSAAEPQRVSWSSRYRYSLSKKPDKIDSDSESRYR